MNSLPRLMDEVGRAQAGDRAAMDGLLNVVRETMKGYFARRTGPDDSSDLAQEMIIRVSDNLDGFQGADEKQFWAWVHRMGRNLWNDKLRHEHRDKRIPAAALVPLDQAPEQAAAQETPSGLAQSRESQAALSAALKTLEPSEQTIIQRRYFEDRSWVEIATELNKTEAAIKKAYQRAIKKWHHATTQQTDTSDSGAGH